MTDSEAIGAEESWGAVERVANESEAALVVGFLQNHDIPARVVDKSFHQTPTTDEELTPIEIAVPSDLVDAARAALAKREAEYEREPADSEAVMTDEGPVVMDGEPGEEEKA